MIFKLQPSLLPFNTFKIDVRAKEMVTIENTSEIEELYLDRKIKDAPYLILGEGSNILFTKNFPGLVIHSIAGKIEVVKENEKNLWLKVESGLNWHSLVLETIKMGLQGLENLSLIPGKVGAAPIQNIGAYGIEIEKFIEEVEAFDLLGGTDIIFNHKECEFGYRTSIFKSTFQNRLFIKSITLKLNKIPDYTIQYESIQETLDLLKSEKMNPESISNAIIHIRMNKLPDPDKIGNAGSFFKNPVIDKTDFEGLQAEFPGIRYFHLDKNKVKIPAAWLIEQCKWKGKKIGNCGVHRTQPLVLINLGNAKGSDIFRLSEKIREDVSHKFGLLLEPEVNILK